MKSFPLISLAMIFTLAACGTTGPEVGDQDGASALTEVSVSLPAKDALPESLKDQDLEYCFIVVDLGKPGAAPYDGHEEVSNFCEVPSNTYSTLLINDKGKYVDDAKSFEAQLDSTHTYQLILGVGPKEEESTEEQAQASLQAKAAPLFYQASTTISAEMMKDKTSLDLNLLLKKMGEGEGPIVIATGHKVDVNVSASFEEDADEDDNAESEEDESEEDESEEDESEEDSESQGDEQASVTIISSKS